MGRIDVRALSGRRRIRVRDRGRVRYWRRPGGRRFA